MDDHSHGQTKSAGKGKESDPSNMSAVELPLVTGPSKNIEKNLHTCVSV